MDQGRILEYGETEAVFQNPLQQWTKELLYAWGDVKIG